LCGVVALIVLAIVSHETIPPPVNLAGCGAAGVCGAVGLLALYRALAVGRMGMAAPISGVLSAAVPVVAGAMLQGVPGSLTLGGFALALAGVWLSITDAGVFQPELWSCHRRQPSSACSCDHRPNERRRRVLAAGRGAHHIVASSRLWRPSRTSRSCRVRATCR
jgi:hypothetical protein